MKLNLLQVLSDDEIGRIHEASVHILERCGVKILSPRMLDFLKGRGLRVDPDTRVVHLSRSCIETALASVPRQLEVFDREGEFAFTLGDGSARIAAGHNAVFWVDSTTGKTRPSTIEDVETFARLCQHLPEIHMIGVPAMPQDAPEPKATLLYGLAACIENSSKPVYFSTDNAEVNRACIALLRAAGGADPGVQAYGISQLSSTSPLYWEEGVLEALTDTVLAGVPLALLPEPNAGISAPYTLAGLLTMHNAECLSGLVMTQLLRPGAKVLYGSSWTTTDMRTGAALVGSTETTICRIAGAQLARFYGTPSHTTAPNSDNHAHDEQNAWEKTFSMFAAVAAGNDLIVNCGMFATGMTCSHEQLLMDEEIAAMSRRMARGLTVDEDTMARELIESVGPQGEMYLTTDHTLRWLHSEEHLAPRLSVRSVRAAWEAAGAKDTYQRARDKVAALARLPGAPLEAARRARLAEIVGAL